MFEPEDNRKYWVILCSHKQAEAIAKSLQGIKGVEVTLFDGGNLILHSIPEIKDRTLEKLGRAGLEIPGFEEEESAIKYMKTISR